MQLRGSAPIGFDVTGSPFAPLREDFSLPFADETLALADYTPGYIYLDDLDAIERCDWVPGFVTRTQFVSNKPFYRSLGRHYGFDISSVGDLDRFFIEGGEGRAARQDD